MGTHRADVLFLMILAGGAAIHCGSDDGGGSNGSGGSGAVTASGGGGAGTGGNGAGTGAGGLASTGGAGTTGGVPGSGGVAGADDGGVAADCSDPEPAWHASWEALEADAIARINQVRQAGATCGTDTIAPVGAVEHDDALTANARTHSVHMSENGLGTTGPNGSSPAAWALGCFEGSSLALNVAMGHTDASALVDSLLMDPGTCANLFAAATHIGVGFYSTATDGGTGSERFWTVLLAQ